MNIILCVVGAINFAQVLLMLFEVLQMLLMLLGHFWCCLGIARLFGVLYNVIISVFGVLPMYVWLLLMWFVVMSMFCECCTWCFFSSTTINPLFVFVRVLHLGLRMVVFQIPPLISILGGGAWILSKRIMCIKKSFWRIWVLLLKTICTFSLLRIFSWNVL